jgi:hypothetical protein
MSLSAASDDGAAPARNDEARAKAIMTGMLGVGIVPFVDRRQASAREQVEQDDVRPRYDDVVDRVRAEMARLER